MLLFSIFVAVVVAVVAVVVVFVVFVVFVVVADDMASLDDFSAMTPLTRLSIVCCVV